MDPQKAWEEMLRAYDADHRDMAREFADGLMNWLNLGGFPPKTHPVYDLDDDWNRLVALAACALVTESSQEETLG